MGMEIDGLRPGVMLMRDRDGLRHAAPIGSIRGVHELADGGGTAIAVAGQVVVVESDFDTVVSMVGWVRRA